MARPRSKIIRKPFNNAIDVNVQADLRRISSETGIPLNFLLENAIKFYIKNKYPNLKGDDNI